MSFLLDTNIALRIAIDPLPLPESLIKQLQLPRTVVWVSVVVPWEISIKAAAGKLDVDAGAVVAELEREGIGFLTITAGHAVEAGGLPRIHGDPFDRMMIAQARMDGLRLVTSDRLLERYDADVLLVR